VNVFAQAARAAPWGLSFGDLVILVIIVAAVFAVAWVALKQMGVQIPQWVTQILFILVVAFFAIVAIRLLLSM
jgi:uncharacterized membrane protein